MAVMNGSTDVGAVDDRRKKPPDNCVAPFNPNEMLQNKNVQVENEEGNEENNYFLGCAKLAAFESQLNAHFITYFNNKMLILDCVVYTVLTMHPTKEPSRWEC
eukprot:9379467-Ditylum_brightwellii.AAC.1